MAIRIKFHFLPFLALFAAGCGHEPSADQAHESTPAISTKSPGATASPTVSHSKVSDRPANPNGVVFVVEYHHIRDGKGTMFRTVSEFKSDLEKYYKLGFRPCTVSDYLNDKFDMGPGASPMVFTFDDSNPSQLKLLPDGSVDPDCAIGIWQAFAKEHPDFPVRATFYVLPQMWAQKGLEEKKVQMLKDIGCELGNHTITHRALRKLSDEDVKKEIGEASDKLVTYGVDMPPSLALPYGSTPKNRALTHGFTYNGKKYELKACLLVGAEPAPSPNSKRFDPFRLPRVQACAGPYGIDYWLDLLEKGQVKPYVTR